MNKITQLLSIIVANIIGIPTPYGFRLKPKAFMTLKALNDEVHSLRIKYDYAMQVNNNQAERINEVHSKALAYHHDAVKLSKALKEVTNHPSILSPETQEIIKGFKHG